MKWVRRTQVDGAIGALGGAPLWGHEACEGCDEMSVADACGRCHRGFGWSSLWGHGTCEGCADMGVADACG
eukprot:2679544-Pyramimonas_sp.AAC.1